MSRPACKLCKRNKARFKGKGRDGTTRYDYKCSSCHRKGLSGNPEPAIPAYEAIAKAQIPKYSKIRDKLIAQIAELRPIVAEYRAIGATIKSYRNRKKARGTRKYKAYSKHKKDRCNHCGFVAQYSWQLDVDHIDGDHTNNDPSNLQTLCPLCHRTKTMMSREHLHRSSTQLTFTHPKVGESVN